MEKIIITRQGSSGLKYNSTDNTSSFDNSWGRIAQLVTCLTADTFLTADPGVASSIPARSHTFVEIDHEIISMAILLPSADSRRVVVCAQSSG